MSLRRWALCFLVFAFALAVSSAPVQATSLGMQLSSGGSTAVICDNNVNFAGCTGSASDLNPALGAITFIGAVGGWTENVSSGFGPPTLSTSPLLDVSTFDSTAGSGTSPLTILLSVSDLTGPLGSLSGLGAIGGTNSGMGTTVVTQAWLSTSDTAFCASTTCGSVALTNMGTFTGGSFSGTDSGSANTGAGPYSVTLAITIDSKGAADTTSFDDSVGVSSGTPEPSSIALMLIGLLALGFVAFRSGKLSLRTQN